MQSGIESEMAAERKSMDGRIQQVFRDVFEDDSIEVSAGTSSKDIARWDSLAQVRVMVALEEEFGVKFSVDELVRMSSVAEIKRTLIEKGVVA